MGLPSNIKSSISKHDPSDPTCETLLYANGMEWKEHNHSKRFQCSQQNSLDILYIDAVGRCETIHIDITSI